MFKPWCGRKDMGTRGGRGGITTYSHRLISAPSAPGPACPNPSPPGVFAAELLPDRLDALVLGRTARPYIPFACPLWSSTAAAYANSACAGLNPYASTEPMFIMLRTRGSPLWSSPGCGDVDGRSDPADCGGCSLYGDGYGDGAWLCRRSLRTLSDGGGPYAALLDGGRDDAGVSGRWLEPGRE